MEQAITEVLKEQVPCVFQDNGNLQKSFVDTCKKYCRVDLVKKAEIKFNEIGKELHKIPPLEIPAIKYYCGNKILLGTIFPKEFFEYQHELSFHRDAELNFYYKSRYYRDDYEKVYHYYGKSFPTPQIAQGFLNTIDEAMKYFIEYMQR